MIQYAGRFAVVVPLTYAENGWCLGIGAFSLIWGVIIKLILPARLFDSLALPEKPMTDVEAAGSFVASMRKTARKSTKAVENVW
jgi:hypothetical protein